MKAEGARKIAFTETPASKSKSKPSHESAPMPVSSSVAPTPAVTNSPEGFQLSAYFDVYYMHNFNRHQAVPALNSTTVQGASIPTAQNNLHFYDWYHNQLGLNLAELTVKHSRKETAFVLDLDFGQMADINAQAPATTTTGGPTSSTVDEVSKHIGQAVFTYTPSAVSGLTVEAGKMPTHVGLELIKAKDNWNYTRGALFSFGGPFWHTGFHVGYAIFPNRLTASVYLYQGWNTIYENNSSPTFGAQLKWTPMDKIVWVYNYIGGPEQARNNGNYKQVHETNVTYLPFSFLSFAADFLDGSEENATLLNGNVSKAKWTGFAALAKWQIHPKYSVSPRFEIYRDHNGYTLGGEAQTLYTYTLTQALQVSEGFETRFEYRFDHSSYQQRFIRMNGTTANQTAVVLSLLYTM